MSQDRFMAKYHPSDQDNLPTTSGEVSRPNRIKFELIWPHRSRERPRNVQNRPSSVFNPYVPIRSIWTVLRYLIVVCSKHDLRPEMKSSRQAASLGFVGIIFGLHFRLLWPKNHSSEIWSGQPICPPGPTLDPPAIP